MIDHKHITYNKGTLIVFSLKDPKHKEIGLD
jgi:hypothetical protein